MNRARKIVFNSISLITSQFLQRLLGLILVIVVARYYGKVLLGQYSFIMVYMALFAMAANFGFETVMVRDLAIDPSKAKKVFLNIVIIQSLLGLFLLAPMIWLLLATGKGFSLIAVLLFALSLVFMENTSNLAGSILESMNKMYINASFLFLKRFLTTAIVAALVFSGQLSLLTLGISVFIASLSNMIFYFYILKKEGIFDNFYVDGDTLKGLIKIGFPFLILKCAILLFNRIDIMMLSYLKGDEYVGSYSVVYYILESLMIMANSFAIAFFPTMAQNLKESRENLIILFNKTFKLLFLISIFLTSFISITGPKIAFIFYGEKFYQSGIILAILIWTLVFYSMDLPGSRLLFAADKKKELIGIFICGIALNAGINLLLIPRIGAMGTAIATLISMLFIFSAIFWFVNTRFFKINMLGICWKGIICAGLMALIIKSILDLNLVVLIAIAFFTYPMLLYVFRVLGNDDIELFKKLIMKKDIKLSTYEA